MDPGSILASLVTAAIVGIVALWWGKLHPSPSLKVDGMAELVEAVGRLSEQQGGPPAPDLDDDERGLHEARYRMARAINELPERKRMIVTLHTYEGLTFEEIAQILGASVEGVRASYGQAMEQLALGLMRSG